MNKLLTLSNMELKRNSRFYIMYICLFSFLTLGLNIVQMNRLKDRVFMLDYIKQSFGGVTYGIGILDNNNYLYLIICIGLIGLLIYTAYMWAREYIATNKSIYTLIMIPQNKFNIYISKMVATIVMVYGFLLSQVVMIFVCKEIFNLFFRNNGLIKTSLANDLSYSGLSAMFIPLQFIDFLMVYGLWLVLLISLLFTIYLIGISCKDNPKILIAIMPLVPIAFSIIDKRFSIRLYEILGVADISFLVADILLNLVAIIILNIISYVLINKKFYI